MILLPLLEVTSKGTHPNLTCYQVTRPGTMWISTAYQSMVAFCRRSGFHLGGKGQG